jgi:hypothetical protein
MTHPPTDFRALCAELINYLDHYKVKDPFLERARALVAAPQQGVPSDELRTIAPSSELVWEWYEENDKFFENVSEARQYVANKAARWGAEQARAILTRAAAN